LLRYELQDFTRNVHHDLRDIRLKYEAFYCVVITLDPTVAMEAGVSLIGRGKCEFHLFPIEKCALAEPWAEVSL
jgi:hypothetical protein